MNREHYFDDKNLNREQRRALEKVKRQLIASYPDTLEIVPENDPNIPYSSHPQDIEHIYRSKKYTVILWKIGVGFAGYNFGQRFSITRNEWDSKDRRYKDGLTWDEIMDIKREMGFGERTAIEYYPADSEVVNLANMRHVFLI
jgi:hypothetical protein